MQTPDVLDRLEAAIIAASHVRMNAERSAEALENALDLFQEVRSTVDALRRQVNVRKRPGARG